jgi:quercetin dioxygenase-like cupin family protein
MDIHKIDWSGIPWKEIRKGVEQKAFSGSAATVALHRLMPGHEPRPHSHPHEQIAYIIEGRMMFYIGDEKHEVGPGGLVVIPGGVTHWGEVLGDVPVLNLDVFTPKRPEYAA